jgi:hypothetical protein
LTSIAGLVASLILKSFPQLYGIKVPQEKSTTIEETIKSVPHFLQRIEVAIMGDGETTLVTQVQKLRVSTTDGLDALNKSFHKFAEKVVADSTQHLVDSLTQVMENFNTKINEQFGDNFKQLNEGVGKMLEWQREYTSRVETMTAQFAQVLTGIEACTQMVATIVDKSSEFQNTARNLQVLLNNLNTSLVGIESIANHAETVMPTIQATMNNLTEKFSVAVQGAVSTNNSMLTTQKQAVNDQINVFVRTYNDIGVRQKVLMDGLAQNMEKLLQDSTMRLSDQVRELDRGIVAELNSSLEIFGRNLTGLSQKIVDSYGQLADKFQTLTQIPNNV